MPPKLPDFANISERLRKALRLEHRIVVIGLSDTPPANLPHYEGEPLKACQMLDTVRFEGKSFYTVQNDHYECKNAIRWLGFDESYEGLSAANGLRATIPTTAVPCSGLPLFPAECMKNPRKCAWVR